MCFRSRDITAWMLLLAMFSLVGCVTAPETGRGQLVLIDSADEARQGFKTFEDLKRQKPIARDHKEWKRLQDVGKRIASVVNLSHARWEFVLFESDEPNAFALPGGKIGVYTGILPLTKNDAGLATVIAHEIAHATARHGAERMSQGVLVQIGGAALSAALGGQSAVGRELAMQAYGLGTQVGVMLPYSRTQELEADRIGLLYMARAGYDPAEAVHFWRRFQTYSRSHGERTPEFLSTHPLDDTRIAQIERFLPQAQAKYARASR